MLKRVKSGIPGFDEIVDGGFIEKSINLLSGSTGTGKTIFCLQFIINGAKKYNEKGLFISFQESSDELKSDIPSLGLGSKKLPTVKFVYIPLFSIEDYFKIIIEHIEKFNPKRVVIDSLNSLTSSMDYGSQIRELLYKLNQILKSLNCTTILTSEIPYDPYYSANGIVKFSRFDIEEYLCDGVIVLHYGGTGSEYDRTLRVIKMRRTNHVRTPVPMVIGKDGVVVISR